MKNVILLLLIFFSVQLKAFPQGGVAKGKRIDLTSKLALNNGTTGQFAQLFIPDYFIRPEDGKFDLVFHFHGASWAAEDEVYKPGVNALLFNIHLGGLSSPYQKYFSLSTNFKKILDTVISVISSQDIIESPAIKNLFISSFSAGYAGVREVLKQESYYNIITALSLADGLHSNSDASARDIQMKDFLRFAADARSGKKIFILTHSSIKTSGYDNTTQTADYLIKGVGAKRFSASSVDEIGICYSICDTGNFHLRGYLGETAQDHMKHFYAMDKMLGKVVEILTPSTGVLELPDVQPGENIYLSPNYPNPFNSSTRIRYNVPSSLAPAHIEIKVFNSMGQEVAFLLDKIQPAGTYEVTFSSSNRELSGGVYFLRLKAGDYIRTTKMLLLK